MKKALLLLSGAVLSSASMFGAATNLYGIGSCFGGWGENNGTELKSTSAGVFTAEIEATGTEYFAFCEKLGSWADINNTRYAPQVKDTEAKAGEPLKMVYGVDASWKILPGKYTFTIDTNALTLTVKEDGETERVITYDVFGQLDGLTGTDWKPYSLTKSPTDDNVWTAEFTPKVTGGEFGLRQLINGSQSDWFAAGVTFDATNSSAVLNGTPEGNCTFGFEAEKAYKFTFTVSSKTLSIVPVGGGGGDITEKPLYIIGELGEGWDPSKGVKLTQTGDGIYTWTGKTEKVKYFGVVSKLGADKDDWDGINPYRYGPAAGSSKEIGADGSYAMAIGLDTSWALLPGEYELTFNLNTNTITAKVTGEVEKVITYQVNGQFTGLEDTDWKRTDMTADGNDKWTATIEVSVTGGSFGIQQLTNGGDSGWFAAGITFDASNSSAVIDGTPTGNCKFGFSSTGKYTFTFVPSTKTLTITQVGGGGDITEKPLYFIGELGEGWDPSKGVKITQTGNGIYTWTGKTEKAKYFGVVSKLGADKDDWDGIKPYRYGPAAGAPNEIGADGSFAMAIGQDDSWVLLPGEYELTFNLNTNTIIAKLTGEVEKVITYQVNGQFTGLEDTDWKRTDMTADGNDKWTATIEVSVTGGSFGIQQLTNGGDSGWFAGDITFNAANPSAVIGGTGGNCTFDFPAGKYTFSFVPSTKTLTISSEIPNYIEEIEAENGLAEYYTLQGIKVAEPSNGLFIVVRNGKAQKVFLSE